MDQGGRVTFSFDADIGTGPDTRGKGLVGGGDLFRLA